MHYLYNLLKHNMGFLCYYLNSMTEGGFLNFSLNFIKIFAGLLVGPIASLIIIIGNVGVILGLLPAHVAWAVYTLVK